MNKKVILGIVTLIILMVAVIGIANLLNLSSTTGNSIQDTTTQTGELKEFNIKAFRFGYTPEEIVVNKGDRVKILIDNTDTLHGMRIPKLEINGNDVVEFVADQAGEFVWYCNNMCGTGHREMSGKLIVK